MLTLEKFFGKQRLQGPELFSMALAHDETEKLIPFLFLQASVQPGFAIYGNKDCHEG